MSQLPYASQTTAAVRNHPLAHSSLYYYIIWVLEPHVRFVRHIRVKPSWLDSTPDGLRHRPFSACKARPCNSLSNAACFGLVCSLQLLGSSRQIVLGLLKRPRRANGRTDGRCCGCCWRGKRENKASEEVSRMIGGLAQSKRIRKNGKSIRGNSSSGKDQRWGRK